MAVKMLVPQPCQSILESIQAYVLDTNCDHALVIIKHFAIQAIPTF